MDRKLCPTLNHRLLENDLMSQIVRRVPLSISSQSGFSRKELMTLSFPPDQCSLMSLARGSIKVGETPTKLHMNSSTEVLG
eukprot:5112586-Amphidinium_carterae.1